ncbi:MAG: hypothetical protein U0793_00710 [Gemmataceae bacterium]
MASRIAGRRVHVFPAAESAAVLEQAMAERPFVERDDVQDARRQRGTVARVARFKIESGRGLWSATISLGAILL